MAVQETFAVELEEKGVNMPMDCNAAIRIAGGLCNCQGCWYGIQKHTTALLAIRAKHGDQERRVLATPYGNQVSAEVLEPGSGGCVIRTTLKHHEIRRLDRKTVSVKKLCHATAD